MIDRVLIVEPSLKDETGHHAFVARSFGKLFGPARTTIAANASWSGGGVLDGMTVLCAFRNGNAEVARRREFGRIGAATLNAVERFAPQLLASLRRARSQERNEAMHLSVAQADAASSISLHGNDLSNLLTVWGARSSDHVVALSGNSELALAMAEIMSRGDAWLPNFHLRLMYDDVGQHSRQLTIDSVLARLLSSQPASQKLWLATETEVFARTIRGRYGVPVDVVPHPAPTQDKRARNDRVGRLVLIAGQPRCDKGAAILPKVVADLGAIWPDDLGPLVVRSQTTTASVGKARVEVLDGHITEEAYRQHWREADYALMLHDPVIYARRGSGVVCDAVAAFCPFVCLAGASLAEWDRGGNVAVADGPRAAAAALVRLARNGETAARAAERAAADLAGRLTLPAMGIAPILQDETLSSNERR